MRGNEFLTHIMHEPPFSRMHPKVAAFFKEYLGLPFPREWITEGHSMDPDSGVIIDDVGSVACAFTIGAAKIHGEKDLFAQLSLTAEIATLPYETLSKKGYLLNISLGEAVLLFCRTLRPWTAEGESFSSDIPSK